MAIVVQHLLMHLIVSVVFFAFIDASLDDTSRTTEVQFCSDGEFSARCIGNDVITIKEAIFVRTSSVDVCGQEKEDLMRGVTEGVTSECMANVTDQLDVECSGRRSCEVQVPNALDQTINRCSKSLTAFLYASYKCLTVVGIHSCRACHTNGHARVSGDHGYLASILTAETQDNEGCGSSRCPWLIQVQPGQSINISLIDFTVAQPQQQQQHRPGVPSLSADRCPRFILIKERANPKDTHVCGGKVKEKHLYTSVSNSLEVHIISQDVYNWKAQFLIHYQAIGCADIVPPKYSRMRRTHERCEIDCPGTEHKWLLTCVDNEWQGELGKCPSILLPEVKTERNSQQNQQQTQNGFWSFLSALPLNILIAIVIALTVIIGVIILTTGIVCLKKNHYKSRHRPDSAIYAGTCSEFEFRPDLLGANAALVPKMSTAMMAAQSSQKPRRPSTDLLMRDNTYAVDRCMESRPLPSLPDATPQNSLQKDHLNRVVVQIHPSHMNTAETVDSNQARPTIVCRGGGGGLPRGERRAPPIPVHRSPQQSVPSSSAQQGDNHHYFILDPDVLVEEPATPLSGQSLNHRSIESQTVPPSSQKNNINRVPDGESQHNNSGNGIQLRPIRDDTNPQQRMMQSQNSNSGIGSWP